MNTVARRPVDGPTIVWLVLSLATGLSWLLGHGGIEPHIDTVAVIVIAAFKVRLVLLSFMELRDAPLAWRLVFEGWAVLVPAAMILLYLRPLG